jgi:hypothetical protein
MLLKKLVYSCRVIINLSEYAAKPRCEAQTESQALREFHPFIQCKQLVFGLGVKRRRTASGPP